MDTQPQEPAGELLAFVEDVNAGRRVGPFAPSDYRTVLTALDALEGADLLAAWLAFGAMFLGSPEARNAEMRRFIDSATDGASERSGDEESEGEDDGADAHSHRMEPGRARGVKPPR